MVRYEIFFFTVPEITIDEQSAIESQIDKLIKSHQAGVISFERWGKYRLAYPVRGNEYAVRFLIRFEASQEKANPLLEALRALLAVRYNDLVMRFMITNLAPRRPLEYQRPESLEEAPVRDVDSFLKENKMTGLLGSTSRGQSQHDVQEDDGLEEVMA